MDNASKALVMAGAILIAVMLISLGVLLFNRGQEVANNAASGLNQTNIISHNKMVTKYDTGKSLSYTEAQALKQEIDVYNSQTDAVGQYGKITFSGTIKAGERYDIDKIEYYTSGGFNGCVKQVTLKKAS